MWTKNLVVSWLKKCFVQSFICYINKNLKGSTQKTQSSKRRKSSSKHDFLANRVKKQSKSFSRAGSLEVFYDRSWYSSRYIGLLFSLAHSRLSQQEVEAARRVIRKKTSKRGR